MRAVGESQDHDNKVEIVLSRSKEERWEEHNFEIDQYQQRERERESDIK